MKLASDSHLGGISLALTLALAIDVVAITLLPTKALAFTSPSQRETVRRDGSEIAQFIPPMGIGAPSGVGGATRGEKIEPNANSSGMALTALMPNLNPKEPLFSVTVDTNPKFFFYVPQANAEVAEFVVNDEEGAEVYKTTFKMTGLPGIVSVSLPKNLVSLERNKNYHWYFVISSNLQTQRQDVIVDGWIRRIELSPTLASQLQSKTLRDRSKLYAEAGIWHEALATLAEERRQNPHDPALADDWKKLLESAGIKEIGNLPFVVIPLEG